MKPRPFLLLSLLILVPLLKPSIARPQVDPWEFEVYPYATQGRGVVELETSNAVVADGFSQPDKGTGGPRFASQSSWYNGNEFTYGLTDRVEAAVYADFSLISGHGIQWSGSKYRLRGRLFDPGVLPIDIGWYAELEYNAVPQFDDTSLELELRPIVEKDIGPFSFCFNPKFEKPLLGPEQDNGWNFGYATGAYYRFQRYFSPGIEFFGGVGNIDNNDPLNTQQHYIFPVIWGNLPYGIEYNLGPGFGLTGGSDRVLVKFNVGLERFIGAIFGPSSDSAWFF
jgi:hypothetical protein